MSIRHKKNINLIYLKKILQMSPNYFIISVSLQTNAKINNLKHDLLLLNLWCVRLKNSFYNTLQQKEVVKYYGKISGVHYIVFSFSRSFLDQKQLVKLLDKYKNDIYFAVGKINNIVYDNWRLQRNSFENNNVAIQHKILLTNLKNFALPILQLIYHSFLGILAICQTNMRRI